VGHWWIFGGGLATLGGAIFGSRFARKAAIGHEDDALTLAAAQAENARLQNEIASLRREYDTLMEWSGVGILVLEESGVIQRANTTAAQFLKTSGPSLVGKTLLQATLSEDMDSLLRAAREGQGVREREIRESLPGGSALIVSISPMPTEPGGQKRYLLVAHDVTELRRLETIRRDFVANVSHELRTPLASIRAMAETLQDGALEDLSVAGRFLGTIVTETERLTRIAEDLLILSDAESRQPEKEKFALTLLLEEVVNRSRPQAEKAEISLTADLAPELTVFANHDQMEQVIVNLVDNAIKYTPAGGSVLVTAARDGDKIAVHVKDSGIGIMSADVPRIFERFYRVDKARSRQSGGTGLGLSIVKHIVESHGGSVTVQSEYNHGSTFTFTIPASRE
jgi:two-component system phosphate regulon sensor histidine kinase PhoR